MATITCERRTYADKPHTHVHSYAQLVLPISGALAVTVNTEVFDDDCQNVIYIPPELRHSFHSQRSNQFFVLDIPASYLPQSSSRVPGCQLLDERWKAIRTLLMEEVKEEPISNQRLADLFRYILRLLEQDTSPASVKYIQANYHEDIRVQQLADLEHYNLSYYCEWFQKHYGLSPMSYIRNLRIDAAKRMLESTDHTILQIAQQIGYQHQSTLTRLFQEHAGVPPAEYRKRSRMRVK